ncbi:tyrosine-protein phosphatase [Enterococcus sp. AZ163]|uniref:tyrosine-protein phosphatase n=1 Tax=Enterococcus sp. AZ163 TaxID=2774638 RepID=UPI003D279076
MGNRIKFEEIVNFRDVGGYNTALGKQTLEGVIYRSSMLFGPTPADQQLMQKLNLQTIIDLRAPAELERESNPYKDEINHYYSINLSGQQDRGRAAELSTQTTDPYFMSERYLEYVEGGRTEIGRLFRLLLQKEHYPLVIHCSAGKDRTGVVIYLILLLQGVLIEEIIADYQVSYTYIKHDSRILQNKQLLNVYHSYPEIMEQFHQKFHAAYGTIGNYLRELSFTEDELLQLKHLLVS